MKIKIKSIDIVYVIILVVFRILLVFLFIIWNLSNVLKKKLKRNNINIEMVEKLYRFNLL